MQAVEEIVSVWKCRNCIHPFHGHPAMKYTQTGQFHNAPCPLQPQFHISAQQVSTNYIARQVHICKNKEYLIHQRLRWGSKGRGA